MEAYPDTSFLMSVYGSDRFSATARRFLATKAMPLSVTELGRFEFSNALRMLVFRRLLPPAEEASRIRLLESDIQAGLVRIKPCAWDPLLERAQSLSARYSSREGHRAMDILHVASALQLRASHFLGFDERQRTLARAEGLALNPQ